MATKTVYKYRFPVDDIVSIDMPEGAQPLHVAMQGRYACLWALVDASRPMKERRFRIAGTGHPIKDQECMKYIGTFLVNDGALVFHVFEIN